VKLPSLMRAAQKKNGKPPPEIVTDPEGSPPLQLIVTPFARFTVVMLDWLVQTNGGGIGGEIELRA
jgi:hypothetical protein